MIQMRSSESSPDSSLRPSARILSAISDRLISISFSKNLQILSRVSELPLICNGDKSFKREHLHGLGTHEMPLNLLDVVVS